MKKKIPAYRWAACSAKGFPPSGAVRHITREGALKTLCGHSATEPEIGRANNDQASAHVVSRARSQGGDPVIGSPEERSSAYASTQGGLPEEAD